MLHPGALSQKPGKKKAYLALFKLLGLQKKIVFHATDAAEAGFTRQQFGEGITVFTAANFPWQLGWKQPFKKEAGSLRLISIALVSPMKNHLLVLSALQECRYDIVYHIYGPVKDAAYWQECQQQIARLPSNVKVIYKGEVPPGSVPALLQQAHVCILPSKSENFGHAIYEALSAGRPVITSKATPWNELEKTLAGKNVEPNLPAIRAAIDFFAVMNESEYAEWSRGAGEYAEQRVNIVETRMAYERMFGEEQLVAADL